VQNVPVAFFLSTTDFLGASTLTQTAFAWLSGFFTALQNNSRQFLSQQPGSAEPHVLISNQIAGEYMSTNDRAFFFKISAQFFEYYL
jgi:hypothetical protein